MLLVLVRVAVAYSSSSVLVRQLVLVGIREALDIAVPASRARNHVVPFASAAAAALRRGFISAAQ